MTSDGALAIDTSDEIQAGVVITHDGRIVQEGVAALLPAEPNLEEGSDVDGTAD